MDVKQEFSRSFRTFVVVASPLAEPGRCRSVVGCCWPVPLSVGRGDSAFLRPARSASRRVCVRAARLPPVSGDSVSPDAFVRGPSVGGEGWTRCGCRRFRLTTVRLPFLFRDGPRLPRCTSSEDWDPAVVGPACRCLWLPSGGGRASERSCAADAWLRRKR